MWPFLLTWICSDLSFRLWQLMDDWWCRFSSVSGKAKHLGESVSLTHSDLALTCIGQQKIVNSSLCLSSFPCLIITVCLFFPHYQYQCKQKLAALHFQIQFTLCSLIQHYCFKILLVAVQLTIYFSKYRFFSCNAWKTPDVCRGWEALGKEMFGCCVYKELPSMKN